MSIPFQDTFKLTLVKQYVLESLSKLTVYFESKYIACACRLPIASVWSTLNITVQVC